MTPINWAALAAPFPASEIDWRVGQKSKKGDRATLLAYLTSRAVQDRLDTVVGPDRWRDSYETLSDSQGRVIGFLCTLEIEVSPGVWIAKTDISDTTDIEALKGGVSGALKRAAVKWGVGRYLYDIDSRYLPIKEGYPPRGSGAIYCPIGPKGSSSPGHIDRPKLPSHMLPSGSGAAPQRPEGRPTQEQPAADRRTRLRQRIERLEKTMSDDVIAAIRERSGLGGDLQSITDEDLLVTYGKALAQAAKGRAA